ncbi:MAG: hypothetical protein ACP6IY_17050 [Promethearchaeia archaeon]
MEKNYFLKLRENLIKKKNESRNFNKNSIKNFFFTPYRCPPPGCTGYGPCQRRSRSIGWRSNSEDLCCLCCGCILFLLLILRIMTYNAQSG